MDGVTVDPDRALIDGFARAATWESATLRDEVPQ
jgi:hypothetical protein